MRFRDQVALITAASRGIGRATAEIMAYEGATIVGVATSAERLQLMEREIRQAGGRAIGIKADTQNPDEVHAIVERVMREYGKIDILIIIQVKQCVQRRPRTLAPGIEVLLKQEGSRARRQSDLR